MDLPECGRVMYISSIPLEESESLTCRVRNIRVTGRLTHHNCVKRQATLTDPQTSSFVCIDTTLAEPLEGTVGSLFQAIGQFEPSQDGPVIKASIMRCVDGLDLPMYNRVLEIQQQYLRSRFS
ncbi:uncharacterized protein LOC133196320 [Saccostrea echinata]|uniref:uncharacterized protein LOC133196320 n=1 Tax=Saccostrea echinata TaxID=191078 RepID=UPI002A83520F|nr:uncharacterized protein LOC133196320 [Saccostrea echinata]